MHVCRRCHPVQAQDVITLEFHQRVIAEADCGLLIKAEGLFNSLS